MHTVVAVLGVLVIASAAPLLARRVRAPAPTLLVVAGLAIGSLPGVPSLHIPPRAITLGVLPPLLFAAAQHVSLPELARVWRPVTLLAVGLVAATAVAVAFVTGAVDGSIGFASAFTLGAVLASTDPVAVAALSRDLHLPKRLITLVQSESLFNDATSLVLFQVAVAVVASGGLSAGDTVIRFLQLAGGGALLGVALGLVAGWVLRHCGPPSVKAALVLVTPYVAAVVAEVAHVSGITAVIVTGLMLAGRGTREPAGGPVAAKVYGPVVFWLENAVFAIIGLALAAFVRALPSAEAGKVAVLLPAVTITLLLVRAFALALGAIASKTRLAAAGSDRARQPWRAAAVVTWAGTRGVVPLAAALSIPTLTDAGQPFPHRPLLLVVATAAVVITLVVQGSTLRPLVSRLGVTSDPERAPSR